MQSGENQPEPFLMFCLYARFGPLREKAFQTPMRELLYHDATVTRYDSGVNAFFRHNTALSNKQNAET